MTVRFQATVPDLTVSGVMILLDHAELVLLACLPRNGEMRRVYLSGKLVAFWQELCRDSQRSAAVGVTVTKSRRNLAEL